jgi:hypothetical protein
VYIQWLLSWFASQDRSPWAALAYSSFEIDHQCEIACVISQWVSFYSCEPQFSLWVSFFPVIFPSIPYDMSQYSLCVSVFPARTCPSIPCVSQYSLRVSFFPVSLIFPYDFPMSLNFPCGFPVSLRFPSEFQFSLWFPSISLCISQYFLCVSVFPMSLIFPYQSQFSLWFPCESHFPLVRFSVSFNFPYAFPIFPVSLSIPCVSQFSLWVSFYFSLR